MPVRGKRKLGRALTALMAKFSSQDDASDQPPDDLAPKKGLNYSIGDDSNTNNRGSSKQLSKHKRRQMKRAQATGGLLGGLQKLVARHKPEDNLFDKLTKLLKLASKDKFHPASGSDGKSKGKQQTPEKKPDRVDKSAADTQDQKTFQCRLGEGK